MTGQSEKIDFDKLEEQLKSGKKIRLNLHCKMCSGIIYIGEGSVIENEPLHFKCYKEQREEEIIKLIEEEAEHHKEVCKCHCDIFVIDLKAKIKGASGYEESLSAEEGKPVEEKSFIGTFIASDPAIQDMTRKIGMEKMLNKVLTPLPEEKADPEGRRQGWDDGKAILKNREKEILEMIDNIKQDCRPEIKVWLRNKAYTEGWNDCLEELKAEIKGARK